MVRLHIRPKSKPSLSTVDSERRRPALPLPQPRWNGKAYRYVAGDALEHFLSCQPFFLGQNVWVCKSKGAKRAQISSNFQGETIEDESPKSQHRYELFLRAVVIEISDEKSRIRVQYPQGSTYLVQPHFLIPILDEALVQKSTSQSFKYDANDSNSLVLVYPETSQYRRVCVLHTAPSEHFVEIGCAEGITCHRVLERSQYPTLAKERVVLGIDKSSFSIQIARKKYASRNLHFVTLDILRKKEGEDDPIQKEDNSIVQDIVRRLQQKDPTEPSSTEQFAVVVAVDINGNRDLDPVLQCIDILMQRLAPRLIIVKSRSLHNVLKDCELR
jgi:hypothetical protein